MKYGHAECKHVRRSDAGSRVHCGSVRKLGTEMNNGYGFMVSRLIDREWTAVTPFSRGHV